MEITVGTFPRALSTEQSQSLKANFDKVGPFYLLKDVHSMLDCGVVDQVDIPDTPHQTVPSLDTPLVANVNGILRQEFFGGIYCDFDRWQEFMVDQCGFDLLNIFVTRPTSANSAFSKLAERYDSCTELLPTLNHLVTAGLVDFGNELDCHVSIVPAYDMNITYLQAPTIVEVEVTYGCYRTCRHCAYNSAPDIDTSADLTADEWATVFAKLSDIGVFILQLTGGDPLFRDDIFDIIEAADAAGLGIYLRSDTVAVRKQYLERLSRLENLWHIGTSIDGATADEHDWMRGKGAFQLFCDRLREVTGAGIRVSAGATLHRRNFKTVRDIGKLATELGAEWFDVGFLCPVGRATNLTEFVLEPDQVRSALDEYLDGIRHHEYQPFKRYYARRASISTPICELADIDGQLPYMTEWPWNRLRVDPTGNVYTAGKLKNTKFSSGFNLYNADIRDVWNESPNLIQLRQAGVGGKIHGLDFRALQANGGGTDV